VTGDARHHVGGASQHIDRGLAPDVWSSFWPGSSLERSSSVGAPWARARSEGFHDSMNGTAANAAPTAPRGDRRPSEELASAQVDFIVGDDCVIRHPTALRSRRTAARTIQARGAISYLAGGRRNYTQTKHPLPGAPPPVRSARVFPEFNDAQALRERIDLRGGDRSWEAWHSPS